VPLESNARSAIMIGDPRAEVLKAADVIILDEVSSLHKEVLFYIDRLLCDIDPANKELAFAGKIVILGGDWKQAAAIPNKRSFRFIYNNLVHDQQWEASVKNSKYFRSDRGNKPIFETTRLTINNRVITGQEHFKNWLKVIGTGHNVDHNHSERIEVPQNLCALNKADLINFVFPPEVLQDPMNPDNVKKLQGSAILASRNDEVMNIHQSIMDSINGEERIYQAVHRAYEDHPMDALAVNVDDANIEHMMRKDPSGWPPSKLKLKVGAIMLLIRNISIDQGLCNGTRVQIAELYPDNDNIIKCRHVTGERGERGEEFYLFRYDFQRGGDERENQTGGIRISRFQFPLRPGFALTINKAQGNIINLKIKFLNYIISI